MRFDASVARLARPPVVTIPRSARRGRRSLPVASLIVLAPESSSTARSPSRQPSRRQPPARSPSSAGSVCPAESRASVRSPLSGSDPVPAATTDPGVRDRETAAAGFRAAPGPDRSECDSGRPVRLLAVPGIRDRRGRIVHPLLEMGSHPAHPAELVDARPWRDPPLTVRMGAPVRAEVTMDPAGVVVAGTMHHGPGARPVDRWDRHLVGLPRRKVHFPGTRPCRQIRGGRD